THSYNGHMKKSVPNSSNNYRRSNSQADWFKAVRSMASKRFAESIRSHSSMRRRSIDKDKNFSQFHSSPASNTPTSTIGFPRSKSPGDIIQDSRLSHASPGAIESQTGRRNSNALPHDMRYYVYNHSAWTIQIRKE
ncbi:unnamed protein product, partial [Trichobilharzia szidati]